MFTLIKVVAAVFVGVLLGLGITIRSLDHANRAVVAGPWRESGGADDPYTLAAASRSSLLPLGSTEGLTFTAGTDSKGSALLGRCDYEVTGGVPASRAWTLSVLTPEGFPIANAAARYGFTSAEILRFQGEPPQIMVSREASSGNWLPTGTGSTFVLMLRLYDTGLSTVGATLNAGVMPKIRKLGCR